MATQPYSDEELFGPLRGLTSELDYNPPRPATYRTSRFPGFWSAGETPTDTPNPLSGDAPEAQPPNQEPPAPPQTPLATVNTAPPEDSAALRGNDGNGFGNNTDVQFSGGKIDDFGNWLDAVMAGTAPIGQTGLVGLGANLAMGNYTKDYGNWNQVPGWSQAVEQKVQQGKSPMQAMDEATKEAIARGQRPDTYRDPVTGNMNFKGENSPMNDTFSDDPLGNAVAEGTAPKAAPGTPGVVIERPGQTASGQGNGFGGDMPGSRSTPGKGSDSWGEGPGKTQARDPDGGGGFGGGGGGNAGLGTDKSKPGLDAGNRGFNRGGVVTNIHGESRDLDPADPDDAELMAARAEMEGGGRFDVPPQAVADNGRIDDQAIMADEGEAVLQRAAAQAYDPEILEAMNDPDLAPLIADLIEDWLDDGDMDDASDTSDDNSGLGVAQPSPAPRQAAGISRSAGVPMSPRTRLGSINRIGLTG